MIISEGQYLHITGAGQATFDFSAAPVGMHREPQDQSFLGLPGLKIFGAHFQSKHLVALLAATLFLGWKGFLLGLALWVFYKMSQKPGASPGFQLWHQYELLSCFRMQLCVSACNDVL